jgi:hypothetical protein
MTTEPRFHTEFGVSLIHKLAAEARAKGVQLFRDQSGRYFATSRKNPEVLHYVTGLSCDCLEFCQLGSCPHHALLLEELKWLAPDPTPEPQPAVLCDQCGEAMQYLAGVSFACQCGHTWSAEWEPVDKIEMAVVALSSRGLAELLDEAVTMLAADFAPVCGADPDECACREDAPSLLNLAAYSSNEVAAALVWMRDREDVADRMVA